MESPTTVVQPPVNADEPISSIEDSSLKKSKESVETDNNVSEGCSSLDDVASTSVSKISSQFIDESKDFTDASASQTSTLIPLGDSSSSSLIERKNETEINEDFLATSSPSRKRPAGEFLPINAEIKKIGLEISEEQAKQLKNDIRRLSPILVSLRERTLGEISLTSDSGLFEDETQRLNATNESPQNHCLETIQEAKKDSEKVDGVCSDSTETSRTNVDSVDLPNETLESERELLLVLSRVDDDCLQDSRLKTHEAIIESDESRTILNVACDEVVESVENVEGCALDSVIPVGSELVEDATVCGEDKDGRTLLVGDFCLSPKYHDNHQLSRKSPKVVIERTLESSPSGCVETRPREDLDCVRRCLEDDLLEDVRESHESLDTETETETVSDTSELTSINSVTLSDCAEPASGVSSSCPETDSLVSDDVPSEIMTRLESERPEAFTEDSAESLALATGARDEVRSDGSDSGLGSEIPGDPGPPPAPESDSETSFLDRIPDDILSDKDKGNYCVYACNEIWFLWVIWERDAECEGINPIRFSLFLAPSEVIVGRFRPKAC